MIKEAKTKDEILQAIFLRRRVLVVENKYSIYKIEPDEDDLKCSVYIAKEGNKVLGTARVRKEGSVHRIQRMAVVKKARGKGLGSKLIKRILKDYKGKIYLFSPKASIPFYEKLGFKKTNKKQKGKYHTYYRLQNY